MSHQTIGRPETAERLAYLQIRQWILDGTLSPGTRVVLEKVAQDLSMSRTPIRVALRQLASDGLVVIHPHREVVVSDYSAFDLEQIYVVRTHLEACAARASIPRATDADMRNLRRFHQEILLLQDGGDAATFAQMDGLFHQALYRPVANDRLLTIIDDFRLLTLRYLDAESFAKRLPDIIVEHARIVAAAEEHDAEKVVDIIGANLNGTGCAIIANRYNRAKAAQTKSAVHQQSTWRERAWELVGGE